MLDETQQITNNLVSTKIPNPFTIITNEQFQEILDLDPLKLSDIKQSLLDDISMLEDRKQYYLRKLKNLNIDG
jgi:hypothetical protein